MATLLLPVALILLSVVTTATPVAADSPDADGRNVEGDKTLGTADIACGGTLSVTLSLTGTNGIVGDPADIALVLDRSGSMNGTPLADLKSAAGTFVDIIDEATDGALDGTIANGSRIGVISFAGGASTDLGLSTDGTGIKAAINALSAGGQTNHEAAFQAAAAMLSGGSTNDVVIMMTDGNTTAGGNPDDDAASLRAGGAELFMIGLGSVSVGSLNTWASDPDADHVFTTPSSSDLEAIFSAIGAALVAPAATNASVVDTVASHFLISAGSESATKGSIGSAGQVVTWTLSQLSQETVTGSYTVTHDNTTAGGVEPVNASVVYDDDLNHVVTFPSPTVNVHGCAAALDLAPADATNEFDGTTGSQTHSVTATVTDDFGDPVAGITVDFSVASGPNAGAAPASLVTDGSGQATYTYPTQQGGPAGLGTDTINAVVQTGQPNVSVELSDSATKLWQDTTPPVASCDPAANPRGGTVPPASNTNPDGFFVLTATDAVWPDSELEIWVNGVWGPFAVGDVIKYTQDDEATPEMKSMGSGQGQAGNVTAHIIDAGDAVITAIDGSGNVSNEVLCLVPQPPQ